MSDPVAVLDYWLGEVGPDGWYAGGAALDADISTRFADLWQAARDGGLDHWGEGAAGSLALIVLCDQLSRNMHRSRAAAFATDPLALATARRAIAAGWDMQVPEPERHFFYMPFEHSEDAADQALSVQYLSERISPDAETSLHARAHRQIIQRFGRFPYRNVALGRDNTAAEAQFLAEGGYMSAVNALRASHAGGA